MSLSTHPVICSTVCSYGPNNSPITSHHSFWLTEATLIPSLHHLLSIAQRRQEKLQMDVFWIFSNGVTSGCIALAANAESYWVYLESTWHGVSGVAPAKHSRRLWRLPGEWLNFDCEMSWVAVRLCGNLQLWFDLSLERAQAESRNTPDRSSLSFFSFLFVSFLFFSPFILETLRALRGVGSPTWWPWSVTLLLLLLLLPPLVFAFPMLVVFGRRCCRSRCPW